MYIYCILKICVLHGICSYLKRVLEFCICVRWSPLSICYDSCFASINDGENANFHHQLWNMIHVVYLCDQPWYIDMAHSLLTGYYHERFNRKIIGQSATQRYIFMEPLKPKGYWSHSKCQVKISIWVINSEMSTNRTKKRNLYKTQFR